MLLECDLDKVFTLSFFLLMLLIGCRDDIEKVPFWLKPSKLLVSVMPFGGKNCDIVTGKAVQWASYIIIEDRQKFTVVCSLIKPSKSAF